MWNFQSIKLCRLWEKVEKFVEIILQTLYDEGGRKFWVHNTGPLGCLPQKLSMVQRKVFDKHGCLASYNAAAKLFNEGLDHMCRELRIELRESNIIYVDIYAIKYDLIANSTTYGKLLGVLVNTITVCLHRLCYVIIDLNQTVRKSNNQNCIFRPLSMIFSNGMIS